MRDSVVAFKSKISIPAGELIFKGAAQRFIKDITALLTQLGAMDIKKKVGKFYVSVSFRQQGGEHRVSIGDYLVYESTRPYVLYEKFSNQGKVIKKETVNLQDAMEFESILRNLLNNNQEKK